MDPAIVAILDTRRRKGARCACGSELIGDKTWRKLSPEQRQVVRRRHMARAAGHDTCLLCYCRARRLAAPPRQDTRRAVAHVAEDWLDLVDPRRTQRANISAIAPRLGMSEGALERSILRAKRRGLLAA